MRPGQSAGAVPGDIDKFLIRGELVEEGEKPVGFGKLLVVVVRLNLKHHVIHAQPVVAHGALQVRQIDFLPREAFENSEQLLGGGVERVVESRFVSLAALLVAECFVAQVGQAAVDFQIDALKIVQLVREIENFLHERRADFESVAGWRRHRVGGCRKCPSRSDWILISTNSG